MPVLSALEARPTIRSATRTATRLRIRWVNHASYVLTARDVRLMTDPWLFGSAFNNGWDLISETKFSLVLPRTPRSLRAARPQSNRPGSSR